VVQVNGKLRSRIAVPRAADQAAALAAALADQNVHKFVADKVLRKVVFVPGKLMNLVV
jgi:leucyl-tRNA synthetase